MYHKFVKKYNQGYKKKLSPDSTILMNRLFSYMQKGKDAYQSNKPKIKSSPLSKLPTGNKYELIDKNIREKIGELNTFSVREFSVRQTSGSAQVGSDRYIRIFSSYRKSSKTPVHEDPCEKEIESIYIWLFLANYFSGKSCSTKLDIYLYFTDLVKKLPETDGEILDANHANTAFTFACNLDPNLGANEIYIYRREEWFKVFLHETFHSLGIDFASMPQEPAAEEIARTIYRVPVKDIRFYESYTETWAEIMQVALHVFLESSDQTPDPYTRISLLETHLFEHEAPFSVLQCVKVLDHYGMQYTDLFDEYTGKAYKENTPVLAYYIIKSVFLNHASEFIEWCMDHNPGPFFLFFKKTQENVKSLVDFLRTYAKTSEYLEKINKMDHLLDRGAVPFKIGESMRMTSLKD